MLNNLRQRPGRSLFTVAGIAIGIAAFVALGGIAKGFENSWVRMYTARGTDLIVTKAAVLSPIPPVFAHAPAVIATATTTAQRTSRCRTPPFSTTSGRYRRGRTAHRT